MRARFGDFCLETGPRQLRKGERNIIPLSPKAFDVLQLLIEERPDVVAKADILARVWDDTHVSDASLTVAVGEIRKALGDTSASPAFIRTVHRRGYAFCGEVVLLTAAEADAPAAADFWLAWNDVSHPLHHGETVIGRASGLGVSIDHASVSRMHARVIVHGDTAAIEDLRSTNGTFVSGARITTLTRIKAGDAIRLGQVTLTLGTRVPVGTAPTERVEPRLRSRL